MAWCSFRKSGEAPVGSPGSVVRGVAAELVRLPGVKAGVPTAPVALQGSGQA